jgi:hypothetical protein
MTIHSTQLGPRVRSINTESLWGLIVSIWIGSEMLIVLNLPLIGIWIMLLSVSHRWLFPSSVPFRVKDLYATNNSTFDIWMVGLFGFMGDLLIKPRGRACATFAGIHPQPRHGRESIPEHRNIPRRLECVCDTPYIGRLVGGRGFVTGRGVAAVGLNQTGRSFC